MADWHPGQGDSLAPPGFKPKNPIPGNYTERHPTRYNVRPDVAEVMRLVYRKFGGPSQIHLNTYVCHPEGYPDPNAWWACQDTITFDWWDGEGRGVALDYDLVGEIGDFLFYRIPGPDIWWIIYQDGMWTRSRPVNWSGNRSFAPAGPAGSDARHVFHGHVTFLNLSDQRILRPGYDPVAVAERMRESY